MKLKRKVKHENTRLKLVSFAFMGVCLVLIVKLFIIQVLGHKEYRALAEEQYWDLQDIPAKRGDILSSDGFSLASTQTYYLMYAEPQKVANTNKTADDLAEKLTDFNINEGENRAELFLEYKNRIFEALNKGLIWVILEHNLSPIQKETLAQLQLEGIGFEDEPIRFYPEETLASHVLGFVASDETGEKTGYFGIEGYLDRDLRGKPGRVIEEKDALGNPILVGGHKKIDPIDGRTIVLTINRSVQYIVEKRLKEAVEKYDALSGTVIVMDPLTGDVISMANFPSYNPSDFSDFNETKETTDSQKRKEVDRTNSAVSETYEPGSVMKPLTVASAIDLHLVTPETTYDDAGPVKYSDYYIDNWDRKHLGVLNIIQLLQKSNNIGAAWVGHKVGSKNLSKYLQNFGLGEKTGIDLEGEDTGIIRDYNTWTDIDLATVSFGQGISATPLQMLSAFNALANGGELVKPRIVSKVIDENKEIVMPKKVIRRVISKETSHTMRDLLIKAAEGGESKYFNLKNYVIAGKTGTAQIPVNGKYDPQATNATFIGFLPGTNKFSMIVRLNRPQTSVYAAETAVPLWMQLTDDLVKYFGIAPDKISN